MNDKNTTLTIQGKVSYKDEITAAQAARIITYLNSVDEVDPFIDPVTRPVPNVDMQQASQDSGESVRTVLTAREALDTSGAKTNPEKIVALGACILQEDHETFKAEEVKAQFRRAREAVPGNLSRDLTTAVQAGLIALGENNDYYLTSKLDGIFDGDFTFPRTSGNGTKARIAKSTRPKSKVEKPETFASIDVFPTTIAGFPIYTKIKGNRDRLLWALQFAKTENIKGLSNMEIDWLTDHLGAGVPNKQISAAFSSAKAKGHANRSTHDNTIRITDEGTEYLKTIGAAES